MSTVSTSRRVRSAAMLLLAGCGSAPAPAPTAPVVAAPADARSSAAPASPPALPPYRGFRAASGSWIPGTCSTAVPLGPERVGLTLKGQRAVLEKDTLVPATLSASFVRGIVAVPPSLGAGFFFTSGPECTETNVQVGPFEYAPKFGAPLWGNVRPTDATKWTFGPGFVFFFSPSGGEGSFVDLATGAPIPGPAEHVVEIAAATTGAMLASTADGTLLYFSDPHARPVAIARPSVTRGAVRAMGTKLYVADGADAWVVADGKLVRRAAASLPASERRPLANQGFSAAYAQSAEPLDARRMLFLDDALVVIDVGTGKVERRVALPPDAMRASGAMRLVADDERRYLVAPDAGLFLAIDPSTLAMRSAGAIEAGALVTSSPYGFVVHEHAHVRGFARRQVTELPHDEGSASWYATAWGFVGVTAQGGKFALRGFPGEGRRRVVDVAAYGARQLATVDSGRARLPSTSP